jgi:hypothetical protein
VDLAPGVFGDADEALGVVAPGAGGAAVKAVLIAAFVVAWTATLLRRRTGIAFKVSGALNAPGFSFN